MSSACDAVAPAWFWAAHAAAHVLSAGAHIARQPASAAQGVPVSHAWSSPQQAPEAQPWQAGLGLSWNDPQPGLTSPVEAGEVLDVEVAEKSELLEKPPIDPTAEEKLVVEAPAPPMPVDDEDPEVLDPVASSTTLPPHAEAKRTATSVASRRRTG